MRLGQCGADNLSAGRMGAGGGMVRSKNRFERWGRLAANEPGRRIVGPTLRSGLVAK
jgi:hypothetical protein